MLAGNFTSTGHIPLKELSVHYERCRFLTVSVNGLVYRRPTFADYTAQGATQSRDVSAK